MNWFFEKTSFPKANLEKATFINAKFKNYFSSENPFKSANVKNTNFFCAHGLSNKVKKYLVKHGAINVPLEIEYNSKNFKNEIKRKRKKQILPKILIQLLKNQKKTKKLQLGQFTQTINL